MEAETLTVRAENALSRNGLDPRVANARENGYNRQKECDIGSTRSPRSATSGASLSGCAALATLAFSSSRSRAMPERSLSHAEGQPARAIRLVFSFDGGQVSLLSQQSVEMVLPSSDPVEGTEDRTGFWYELRDAQDRPVYRKVIHNPMREDVEVFSDDP